MRVQRAVWHLKISPHLLICGAGIGGLTAALALAQKGTRVTILERAPVFEETGAGVQLSANASRILDQLGVLRQLDGAYMPEKLEIRRARDGKKLVSMPLGASAAQRWGAPTLLVHRADLQRALLDTVALAKDQISVVSGATLASFEQRGACLQACIQMAQENPWVDEVDGIIGADGLNSSVRDKIFPGGSKIYSGRTAWRALVAAEDVPRFALAPQTNLWLGDKAHLVHYPLRGGALVNIVAIVNDEWRAPESADFWHQAGDKAFLLQRFASWHKDARNLLAAAPQFGKWPLFDRAPLHRFGSGRVTLLGDAAHPMLPFLAQGSAQAIEDAAALGAAFADGTIDVAAAFRVYSQARNVRAARVQRQSRMQGQIYHLSGLAAFARDQALSLLGPERLVTRYDWLYGFGQTL